MQPSSHTSCDGKAMRFHVVECEERTGNFTIYNGFMIKYWGEAAAPEASPAGVAAINSTIGGQWVLGTQRRA